VLSLGHNHPELVRVVTKQLGRFAHGLDLPTPAKDAFTERRRAAQIQQRLDVLRGHPWVRDVRGRGLMWGIELAGPRSGRPAGDAEARVQAQALADGLIVELGGRDDCVVRMLPPLNVSAEVVDTACSILVDAIVSCCAPSSDSAVLAGLAGD
jgi:4-aminobutyrate aminotransferase-like enzyme